MSTAISDSRVPWLFAVAMTIGPAAWLMPHQGAISTLLPQRLGQIDPANKVSLVMMFSTIAMLVALISNIVLGACSDRTLTRFGKRKPWIVGCSVLSCLVLVAFSRADTVPQMLGWWCVYEVVVNGVASAMIAQLSDRVPPRWRGTLSSAYGLGQTAGGQSGVLVAAQFLGDVTAGVEVFAAVALCGGVVSALLAGEPSNLDEPAEPFSMRGLLAMFMFPTHGAGDFYKTLLARFLFSVGSGMISGYMLYYILQSYLELDQAATQHMMSVNASIMLVTGLVCCLVAGPIFDALGRVKSLSALMMVLIAVGAAALFVMPNTAGFVVFSTLSGIAVGANASFMQTISVQALPDAKDSVRDLGFLNLSNTLGGAGASCTAAAMISLFGYRTMFLVETVIVLCAAAVTMTIRRMR